MNHYLYSHLILIILYHNSDQQAQALTQARFQAGRQVHQHSVMIIIFIVLLINRPQPQAQTQAQLQARRQVPPQSWTGEQEGRAGTAGGLC